MKKRVLLVLFLLLLPYAQAWSWDQYEGTTAWDVTVTVDEKDCGGKVYSHSNTLTITHKKSVADLTDLGHGPVSGTFFSNILTVQGRTIPDGSGTSALGSASVAFAPDCLSFYTKYPWRYHDSYQDCSGTTAWQGRRTDSTTCPDAFVVDAPAQPRLPLPQVMRTADEIKALPAEEQKVEYGKVLEKNPRDFQSNYAIGHILKDEKNYSGFVKHIDKALENKNYAEKLRKERQAEVKERLGFTIDPTTAKVPLLRKIQGELDTVPNPMIYDFNVLKTPDTRSWYDKWREYWSRPIDDLVRK